MNLGPFTTISVHKAQHNIKQDLGGFRVVSFRVNVGTEAYYSSDMGIDACAMQSRLPRLPRETLNLRCTSELILIEFSNYFLRLLLPRQSQRQCDITPSLMCMSYRVDRAAVSFYAALMFGNAVSVSTNTVNMSETLPGEAVRQAGCHRCEQASSGKVCKGNRLSPALAETFSSPTV